MNFDEAYDNNLFVDKSLGHGRLHSLLGKRSHLKRGQLLAWRMSNLGIVKEVARLSERLGLYSLESRARITHSTSLTSTKMTEVRNLCSTFRP